MGEYASRTGHRAAWAAVAAAGALALLAAAGAPARAEDDAGGERAGDRYVERALRYTKAKNYEKALEFFEKALPFKSDTSDLFYNLVNVSEALKRWDKVLLYGHGFLYLEPDTADAKAIAGKQKQAARRLEQAGRAPGTVGFEVEPAGVEILVEGVPVTRGKGRPVLLPVGRHTARAAKMDHEPWEGSFEVPAGRTTVVRGELKKKIFQGFLRITTDPADGVTVYIDDEQVGVTPLAEPIQLETRRYLVRFEKEGYDRWLRYVEIRKDETFELNPTLERASGASR